MRTVRKQAGRLNLRQKYLSTFRLTDTSAKTSGDSAENAGENDNTSKSETQGTQEPTVLHFTDDGVEKLDSTVVDEKNAASGGEAAASENTGSEDAPNPQVGG